VKHKKRAGRNQREAERAVQEALQNCRETAV
jgi:hypothetical protein